MSRAPGIGSIALVVAAAVVATVASPREQSLGTFRWQLQPFCNAVIVSITERGGVYTVDGVDDQCGAVQRAPLVGTATPNPDGSIGLGFHVVTSPSGWGVDVAARISLSTLSGPWSDSAGNSGTFVFNGTGGGTPRPLPTVPLVALAPGSVGASAINPAQVQTRISGTCPKGHALTFIEPDGRPRCTVTQERINQTGGFAGLYPALAFSATGELLVASGSASGGRLRLVECGSPGCTTGWTARTLDDPGFGTGVHPSIAIGSNGRPVIAHQGGNGATFPSLLRLSRCDDARCTSATSSTIDQIANASIGSHPALAIGSDGLPIVAAWDSTTNTLRVVHCDDATCATTTKGLLDNAIVGPGSSSIAITIGTDGLPLLAYSHDAGGAIRVAHCGDVRCHAGTAYTSLTGSGTVAVTIGRDGLPVLARSGSRGLRLTFCATVTCAAGETSIDVEPARPSAGQGPAVVIGSDGLPIVAHLDNVTRRLFVTHCGDARCTSVVSTDRGTAFGVTGDTTSIAVAPDGLPVVASFDFDAVAARITRCGTVSCQ
jgi:predicted regulator of Ras-like GTPase activity (Roadblock/LC7/MglB family)